MSVSDYSAIWPQTVPKSDTSPAPLDRFDFQKEDDQLEMSNALPALSWRNSSHY